LGAAFFTAFWSGFLGALSSLRLSSGLLGPLSWARLLHRRFFGAAFWRRFLGPPFFTAVFSERLSGRRFLGAAFFPPRLLRSAFWEPPSSRRLFMCLFTAAFLTRAFFTAAFGAAFSPRALGPLMVSRPERLISALVLASFSCLSIIVWSSSFAEFRVCTGSGGRADG